MPLYEYECTKCKQRLEVLQSFNDASPTNCPECDGRLERLLSAPAFQFKGSGWYVTDYARKGKGGNGGNGATGKEGSQKVSASEESEKTEKAEKSEKSDSSTGKSAESSSTAKSADA